MNTRVVLTFTLITILHVFAGPHRSDELEKPLIYCGRKLDTALSERCQGKFYDPMMKRVDFIDFKNRLENDVEAIDEVLIYPFIPQDLAESMIPIKARRLPVDECCQKPCYVKELESYCAYETSA